MFKLRVNRVFRTASRGRISDFAGTSNTSSKVSAKSMGSIYGLYSMDYLLRNSILKIFPVSGQLRPSSIPASAVSVNRANYYAPIKFFRYLFRNSITRST